MPNMKHLETTPHNSEEEWDKIISLPGHILDHILGLLPIRDAVRTSILSRKWRFRWSVVPTIVFDNTCVPLFSHDPVLIKNKLISIVDHVLLLHDGPINKFKLSHRDLLGVSDIDRWILHLSRTTLNEFVLEIWKGQRYQLPSILFSFLSLIHLELFNCLIKPPRSFKGFSCVKSLDLQHVTMTQEVFESLIASCTMLERLTLMNFDGFSHLNIFAPNLQFFDVGGEFSDLTFHNAHRLTLVSIGLYKNVKSDQSGLPGNTNKLLSFMRSLPSIRRLEIQSYFLKYLASGNILAKLLNPSLDLNYLSLRVNFNELEESLAVLCLVRTAPNLQELEILTRGDEEAGAGEMVGYWDENLWSGLCVHLTVVRIVGMSGLKSELGFIHFILSNSPVLEKISLKPSSSDGMWDFVKALLRFRRASPRAEIIYLDPS